MSRTRVRIRIEAARANPQLGLSPAQQLQLFLLRDASPADFRGVFEHGVLDGGAFGHEAISSRRAGGIWRAGGISPRRVFLRGLTPPARLSQTNAATGTVDAEGSRERHGSRSRLSVCAWNRCLRST